jgi:hypothetical protein
VNTVIGADVVVISGGMMGNAPEPALKLLTMGDVNKLPVIAVTANDCGLGLVNVPNSVSTDPGVPCKPGGVMVTVTGSAFAVRNAVRLSDSNNVAKRDRRK